MFAEKIAGTSPLGLRGRMRNALALLIVAAGLLTIVAFIPVSVKAKYQLVLVPLVLGAIWSRRLIGVRIPKLVILGSAAGTLIGAIFQLSHVNLAAGAFLVSTVSDRELRQEAKIYRDRVRKSLGAEGESLVGVYPGVIRDAANARKIVESSPSLGGVIWGGPRWMSVTLRQYEPISLSSLPERSIARDFLTLKGVSDLLLVSSIPTTGMSHGYERGTVYFLGEVVRAWRLVPEMLKIGATSGEFEGRLEALARIQARWTARAHIALPLWLAGTAHLIRAIETESLQDGELSCAISDLREAAMQFRTADNPALEMAVRNNYALALLVKAQYASDSGKLKNKANQQLAHAMRLSKNNKQFGTVVALNYIGLMQARRRSVSNDGKK
jgi:hypothetical protein